MPVISPTAAWYESTHPFYSLFPCACAIPENTVWFTRLPNCVRYGGTWYGLQPQRDSATAARCWLCLKLQSDFWVLSTEIKSILLRVNCASLENSSTKLQTKGRGVGPPLRRYHNGGGSATGARLSAAAFSGTRVQRCTFERCRRRKRRVSHSMGGSALSLNLYAYNYTCISPEGPKVRNSTRKSPKKTRRMKRRTIRRRKRYRNEAVVVCSMHARLSLVNQPYTHFYMWV